MKRIPKITCLNPDCDMDTVWASAKYVGLGIVVAETQCAMCGFSHICAMYVTIFWWFTWKKDLVKRWEAEKQGVRTNNIIKKIFYKMRNALV